MSSTNHNPQNDPTAPTELLSAYLDGELTVDERAQVEQLLAGDPESRRLLAELRAVSDSLHQLPNEPAPSGLRQSVLEAACGDSYDSAVSGASPGGATLVDRLPIGRSKRGWAWAAAIAVAAALLLMVSPQDEPREVAKSNALPAEPQPLGIEGSELAVDAMRPELHAPATMEAIPPAAVGEEYNAEIAGGESRLMELGDSVAAEELTPERRSFGTMHGGRASGELRSDARKSSTVATTPAIVVRVALRREAFVNRFVDTTLGDNGILIRPTPAVLTNNLGELSERNLRRMNRSDTVRDGTVDGDTLAEVKNSDRPSMLGSSFVEKTAGQCEIMLVDAPAPPVIDFVSQLNRDFFNCVSIDVEGAEDSQELQAYNFYQQQVVDNQDMVDTLGVYSRSGAAPEQQLAQRAQPQAAPRQYRGLPNAPAKGGKITRSKARGFAYKVPAPEGAANDKNLLYSQLSLLANTAVTLAKSTEKSESLGRGISAGGTELNGPVTRFDFSSNRVPLVLLCCPADPEPNAPTSETQASETRSAEAGEAEPAAAEEPAER